MTNFHRIILTIETDGSITAQEAMTEASAILKDHFAFLMSGGAHGESDLTGDDDQMDTEEISDVLGGDDEESDDEDESDAKPKKRGRPKKGSA